MPESHGHQEHRSAIVAPKPYQIAGAVLEEAILSVLVAAGYRSLDTTLGDPTIVDTAPRFTVKGRGTSHQIDAIADPCYSLPFSNPARLLIEAKAYSQDRRVGLPVVRNALGTMRDLMEFWTTGPEERGGMQRYHYRYAVFATSDFTRGAQEFAFAQDIYLLPLRRSAFFAPVVDATDAIREHFEDSEEAWDGSISLTEYRENVRAALREGDPTSAPEEMRQLVHASSQVRAGVIGMAVRRFPLFLVPQDPEVLRHLESRETVRIKRGKEGWLIQRKGEDLFSFDLPEELFLMYSQEGEVRPLAAVDMKLGALSRIDVILGTGREVPRLIQLEGDVEWLQEIRARLVKTGG